MLKPVDIIVLIELVLRHRRHEAWTQVQLAQKLGLSQSAIHRALRQLERSRLWRCQAPRLSLVRTLLVDALPIVFPADLGAPARGIPTAHAIPVMSQHVAAGTPYVWPSERGEAYGPALSPLHPGVPDISLEDAGFYELMALADVFRVGRVRERRVAESRLAEILEGES